MELSKDLVAASATPLILAVLHQKDSYGYEILKTIKEASSDEIVWTEGMLYPVLHRLEKNGLVESYWKTSQEGRQRKYYRLMPAGRTELENFAKQWELVHSVLTSAISAAKKGKDGADV